jgi:hypothetical protein
MSDGEGPVVKGEAIHESNAKLKDREDKEEQQAVTTYAEENNSKVSMMVKVYSPSRVYYDGPAFSLTATNRTGEFDVLPKHHSFICLLEACTMVVRTLDNDNHTITISGGLLHVKADKTIVFLDI